MARPRKEQNKRKATYVETSPLEVPESFKKKLESEDKIYRWIRVLDTNARYDHKNVGKRIREGWEFVTEDEIETNDPFLFSVEVQNIGRLQGIITVGDVALAKHFKDFKEDRTEKMVLKAKAFENDIDAEIRRQQGNKLVPLDTHNSKVTESMGSREVNFE
jgi:hypothetical protein